MKAYRHLVNYALGKGFSVSVWDGEEWQIRKSNKFKEITDAIESVDEAELRIRDSEGKKVSWVRVSAYGLADDETVIDCDVCEFMNEWEDAYNP